MATQLEFVKIISGLIPQYEGESDKLASIVDAMDAFMTDATRQTGIRVILSSQVFWKSQKCNWTKPANCPRYNQCSSAEM